MPDVAPDTTHPTTLYVARTIGLAPHDAAAAFDLLHDLATPDGGAWTFEAGGAVCRLATPEAHEPDGSAPVRVARATVRPGGWLPHVHRATVEIRPWSATRSEIGIRPARLGFRESRRRERWFDAAASTVEGLVQALASAPAAAAVPVRQRLHATPLVRPLPGEHAA